MQSIDKDPYVAQLFERIEELRSSYVNDQLEAEDAATATSDIENARDIDDEYFEEAPAERKKKRKISPESSSAPSVAGTLTPVTVEGAASVKSAPCRMRSVPSIDRGFSDVTPTPPATPRPTADFTPPPMSADEKAELTKVLQQIALLELTAHFDWSMCLDKIDP